MKSRIVSCAVGLAALFLALPADAVPVPLDGPTTDWTALAFGGAADADDAGNPESEIVGDPNHSAVYYAFDDLGTPSLTDGTLYFRMRLGQDQGGAGFSRTAIVGIDADLDGGVDLLVGIVGQSSVIVRHVTGAGTSPSTTGISATGTNVTATAANSNWSAVSSATDPTASDFDLNNDGTDYFISWSVDFATVVQELQNLGIGGFTQVSAVRFVAGTSTNNSNLNQDIAGTTGNTGSATPWGTLGAFTSNPVPVPEPGTGALLALGLAALGHHSRRAGSRRR